MTTREEQQADLDRRCRITPEDRLQLAAGETPAKLKKSGANLGCLSFGVTLLGAGAGAFFAFNTFPIVEARLPMGRTPFVVIVAVIGATLARAVFKRRFGRMIDAFARHLAEGRVQNEVLDLRLEPRAGQQKPLLVASDGRAFQAPLTFGDAPLAGRYRVYFLDFAPLRDDATAGAQVPAMHPLVAIALEIP